MAKKRKSGKVKLGYWGIRGLGSPLRLLLEYVGADYEDKHYTDGVEWFEKDKPELLKKNAFANLPYIVDGDTVICQTNAIFEYLGDRYGLNGNSMKQKQLNAQALAEIYDLRNAIIDLVYAFKDKCRDDKEFEVKMKLHATEGYKVAYSKLENFFKMNKGPFSCGLNICTADFHIFEMLDQHELYCKSYGNGSVLNGFPALAAFYAKFKLLPQLQKYFSSPAYKLTCNAAMAYTSKHPTKPC